MDENELPKRTFSMGRSFNSHFGSVELPSDILQIGIFDNHLEFDCEEGVYHVFKSYVPNEGLIIKKIWSKAKPFPDSISDSYLKSTQYPEG